MPGDGVREFPIRGFLGVNLRDAADQVNDREVTKAKNVFQAVKGAWSNRWGTSTLPNFTTLPALCSRVSGVWRHYAPNGVKTTLNYCEPDSTLLPDNTTDLTLSDINNGGSIAGDIFGGGSVATLYVCYSWIGRGMEQTYNSKNRAGFPSAGSFPLNASANGGHQTITLSSVNHYLGVTIPAFPTGVVGANIFVARGTATEMAYMGTITTSGGQLIIKQFIGPRGASSDPFSLTGGVGGGDSTLQLVTPVQVAGGTLTAGTYYIAAAWVTDPNIQEGSAQSTTIPIQNVLEVTLTGTQNAIAVNGPKAASANGARAAYIFIGTQNPNFHPMTCVGILRCINPSSDFIDIKSVPSTNSQSHAVGQGPDQTGGYFMNQVMDGEIGGFNYSIGARVQARFGFLMGYQGSAPFEIFPSRTLLAMLQQYKTTTIYQGDSPPLLAGAQADLHNFVTNPRTTNDRYQGVVLQAGWVQPYSWNYPASEPTFAYQLGITFIANGADITWMTDGYTLGQLTAVQASSSSTTQTLLPPPGKFIFVYQSGLVLSGGPANNQVYGANANAPQNWAPGGTGSLGRFVTIGDAVGSGVTAQGLFTPSTEATDSPNSFLVSFKKNGTWMIQTIPDPTSSVVGAILGQVGSPMTQVSGRVGCVAYRSVVQATQGLIFLGQDANVYLINAIAEPRRIGTKIQPALSHLVGEDAIMQLCTAVFHDNHYKLSYPSPAALLSNPVKNDSQWWLDLRTGDGSPMTWSGPHSGIGVGPQVVLAGDSDDMSRIGVNTATGIPVKLDDITTIQDLGSAITFDIVSKKYRMGSEGHFKRLLGAILDLYVDFSYSNTVNLWGYADAQAHVVPKILNTAGGIWDSSKWDMTTFSDADWQKFNMLFGPSNLVGSTISWEFIKTDAAPFSLAAVTLLTKTERRRLTS